MKKSARRKTSPSHSSRHHQRKRNSSMHVFTFAGLMVGLATTLFFVRNFPPLRLFAAEKAEVHNAFPQVTEREKGRIIVKLKGSVSELSRKEQLVLDRVNKKNPQRQATTVTAIDKLQVKVIKVPPGEETAVLTELKADPDVVYAEVDGVAQAAQVALPNDEYFTNLYALHNTGQIVNGVLGKADADLDAPEAWTKTTGTVSGGDPVLVAVLDTGIDIDHPELGNKIASSASCIQASCVQAPADDDYGHGTHVAGTIGASMNNSIGVAGVCPDCRFLNGKVWDNTGSGYYSWMANGIIWATDNGAKVINISGGGTSNTQALVDAVNYAWSKGVIIVAAAGNSNTSAQFYPASIEPVIAVASTDGNDKKSSFSNYGSWVDIAAPGSNIYSTLPVTSDYSQFANWGSHLSYGYLQGTSMATPHVAGTAGLVWASSYGTSASAVRSRILSTADPITGTGTYWMNGRVNAGNAVGYTTDTVTPSDTPTPTNTPIPTNTPTSTPIPSPTGLAAVYYDNADFTGSAVSRVDQTVNFNWGSGVPVTGIGADTFSVRWTGYVIPQYSQTYRFYARTNDGVRLWVNNQQLINNWQNQGTTEVSGTITLSAGVSYPITLEYYDNTGTAVAQLRWSSPSRSKQIIPSTRLSH